MRRLKNSGVWPGENHDRSAAFQLDPAVVTPTESDVIYNIVL